MIAARFGLVLVLALGLGVVARIAVETASVVVHGVLP